MSDKYQDNSYNRVSRRSKDPSEALTPIAEGHERKKSFMQKIAETFVMATPETIKERMWTSWIVPTVKSMLVDALNTFFFGGAIDPAGRSRGDLRVSKRSYNDYYDGGSRRRDERAVQQKPSMEPEIMFDSFEKANDVKNKLLSMLEEYHRVTLKDLRVLSNMKTDYAMTNVGWRDLSGMTVVPIDGEFMLKMPRLEALSQ